MSETDFLKALIEKTGCQLLLDINNVYVNAINFKFDAWEFINNIPMHAVSQIHLAGFSDKGDYLFDDHSKPVFKEVWNLYEKTMGLKNNIPTLIEWDESIPKLSRVLKEATKAKDIWKKVVDAKNATKSRTRLAKRHGRSDRLEQSQ